MRPKLAMQGAILSLAMLLSVVTTPALAEDDEPTEITYFDLKPSIVSNLNGGPKYIRCNIQLMFKHPSKQPLIELHAPALRHEILMMLPDQDGNALQQAGGKESLRQSIRDALRQVMKDRADDEVIDDVYFTAYYVR